MRLLMLVALLVCGVLMASCAGSHPNSTVVGPRIEIPTAAARPCRLHRLPAAPTVADLEIGYAMRGADLVACDGARQIAVATHRAEHALEDAATKQLRGSKGLGRQSGN